jgi:hypothetical protein
MSHPYYNVVGNQNIYTTLQKWVYPDLSVDSLRLIFPVITNTDIVYLSLVFHPIQESINFFDGYTLFYHACRIGHPDPLSFITSEYPLTNLLALIAYKFKRYEILVDSRLEDMARTTGYSTHPLRNIVALKTGKLNIYEWNTKFHRMLFQRGYWFLEHKYEVLFSDNELMELFIMDYTLGYSDAINEERYEVYIQTFNDLINSEKNRYLADREIVSLSHRLGKDRVSQIILQYLPHYAKQLSSFGSYPVYKALSENNLISNKMLLRHPELVAKYIPENRRGMYYITSGDFGGYVNWINAGGSLSPIDNNYIGINEFGECSLDRNLVAISKEEFKFLSLQEIKRSVINYYNKV